MAEIAHNRIRARTYLHTYFQSTCEDLARKYHQTGMECAALNQLASQAVHTHQLETVADLLNQALFIAAQSGHKRWLAETEWSLAHLRSLAVLAEKTGMRGCGWGLRRQGFKAAVVNYVEMI